MRGTSTVGNVTRPAHLLDFVHKTVDDIDKIAAVFDPNNLERSGACEKVFVSVDEI